MKAATKLFFLLAVFVLAPHAVPAANLWVAPAPPAGPGSDAGNDCQSSASPCETIQHAVDQTANNDTISIVQGIYTENIVIDKTISALTIQGGFSCSGGKCTHNPDPRLTVVDGGGSGMVIYVNRLHAGAGTVRFENLTIQNGDSGGLRVSGGSGSPSTITVADCIIANNEHYNLGGGAAVTGNDVTLEILDSTIRDNKTQRGGGVAADCGTLKTATADVQLIIKRSMIQANEASADGGGIYAASGTTSCTMHVTLEGNIIGSDDIFFPFTVPVPNDASYGGGLCLEAFNSGVVEVYARENTINANTSNGRGAGVLFTSHSSGTVKGQFMGNWVIWNTANVGGPAGVAVSSYDGGKHNLVLADNIVSTNDGQPAGIGVEAWGGADVGVNILRNSVFWNGNDITEAALDFKARDTGTRITAQVTGNWIAANARAVEIAAENSAVTNVTMVNNYVVDHADLFGIRLAAYAVGTTPPNVGGSATLVSINNTITNNGTTPSTQQPPGLAVQAWDGGSARAELYNTLLWNNGSEDVVIYEDDTLGDSTAFVSALHCDIGVLTNGPAPFDGTYTDLGHNISQNPLFVNPALSNYELSAGPPLSPAADAGICDDAITGGATLRIAPLLDFQGDPRPPSPTTAYLCDIGADEIDHCRDNAQNFDETGVDCGGDRCAPCGCTIAKHVARTCSSVGLLFDDFASAYAGMTTAGVCEMEAHRMEFQGVHSFTNKSTGGGTIEVKLSGGWDCALTTRSPGDHTTIHGLVVIGGDTLIEADGIGIR